MNIMTSQSLVTINKQRVLQSENICGPTWPRWSSGVKQRRPLWPPSNVKTVCHHFISRINVPIIWGVKKLMFLTLHYI
ncbi:hypothetical protein CDL12_07374 [Handroanthus impetiginosus]|uniref:Uncharacterized protein n=1 Tax=Handroanthus impetiginosus TaxID=429701 RepID=A0A2G9HR74_9LAMI|nr:hypothetical protein CDL12_07374 [Handroanthus impetiginosus]